MSPLIECQNLDKTYAGKTALKNVSFTCQAGEPIALVGPNGAGKTTLFSILCDYIRPTSGSVKILGFEPGDKALLGQVSALPQDAQFDPGFSIHSQLSFYAKLQGFKSAPAKQEAERVLALMGLEDNLHSLPNMLSHGMRKRAAIAQALIGQPKLVLLDEPTAGLDPANAKKIRQLISSISAETTFIISSHNLQELERLCNTVLYLEKGELQQQNHSLEDSRESFLTVHVQDVPQQVFIDEIKQLSAVKEIQSDQKNEFLITYDGQNTPDFDQHLLKTLADKNWPYRRLIKGKTLEEKLFS
ncbi:MAG: ABC transporter ATP-binding protein [Pseudomonadales bacterium]|nr:ABC transporter ATP-binding protein [Pseudomonadales bacterium]